MRNVSEKVVVKIKTHTSCPIIFFKSCQMWDVEKYCRGRQATNDSMVHGPCMLDILRICNTCFFSTKTMVSQTHLNVTLHIHCLSCAFLTSAVPLKRTNDFITDLVKCLLTPRCVMCDPISYIKINHHSQLKFLFSVFSIHYSMFGLALPSSGNK